MIPAAHTLYPPQALGSLMRLNVSLLRFGEKEVEVGSHLGFDENET